MPCWSGFSGWGNPAQVEGIPCQVSRGQRQRPWNGRAARPLHPERQRDMNRMGVADNHIGAGVCRRHPGAVCQARLEPRDIRAPSAPTARLCATAPARLYLQIGNAALLAPHGHRRHRRFSHPGHGLGGQGPLVPAFHPGDICQTPCPSGGAEPRRHRQYLCAVGPGRRGLWFQGIWLRYRSRQHPARWLVSPPPARRRQL